MATSVVQTRETQESLSPQEVLRILKDGNERFVGAKPVNKGNYRQQIAETAKGQFPFAAMVSCVDSRVAVEDIFDLNNGDAFSGRLAGNVVNEDMLGSLEFATAVAGAKVILILGHTGCGAIKGACDGVELGNLTTLLDKIKPSVEKVREDYGDLAEAEFIEAVCEENVRSMMQKVIRESGVIKDLIESGKVLLVGGVYDLATGKVRFIN